MDHFSSAFVPFLSPMVTCVVMEHNTISVAPSIFAMFPSHLFDTDSSFDLRCDPKACSFHTILWVYNAFGKEGAQWWIAPSSICGSFLTSPYHISCLPFSSPKIQDKEAAMVLAGPSSLAIREKAREERWNRSLCNFLRISSVCGTMLHWGKRQNGNCTTTKGWLSNLARDGMTATKEGVIKRIKLEGT